VISALHRAIGWSAGIIGVLLTACAPVEGPNVVLVTLDTTRADRLGAMGDENARTPAIDALAARGVVFERAYSPVALTLPSHTTILTGLDPNLHGVHDNGRFTVPTSLETVAERLSARGYATAAFVSAFVLDAVFGLDQGFSVYDDETDRAGDPLRFSVPTRRGAEVPDRALAWLARADRPFFIWVHYYDVHAPRQPPPPYDELGDAYAGELAYVDAQVRRLVEGITDASGGRETLLVVVGDHGESLGEHDELTHGVLAYDSTLHVPLIVVGPGFPPGTRTRLFARTVDLAQTLLKAAGEPPLPQSPGLPLQARLREGAHSDGEVLGYFESFGPQYGMGWARIGGVRTSRWKYTAEPEPVELYDVEADPGEHVNRVAEVPEVVQRLARQYAERRPTSAGTQDPRLAHSLDIQEKLAALGYLVGTPQSVSDENPDPRKVVGAMAWIDSARALALEGRVADSLEALEIFATSPVARPLALRSLGPLYTLVGRTDEAVAAYATLAELMPGIETRIELANALLLDGRPEEAVRALDGITPSATEPSGRFHLCRARVLLALDRVAEAEGEVGVALALDPRSDLALALASRIRASRDGVRTEIARLLGFLQQQPDAHRLVETRGFLAELLHSEGRDREAAGLLEGLEEPPPEHRAILAGIAAARGNLEKGAALYESALEDRAASQVYRRELADLYGALGRLDDAIGMYRELIAAHPGDATLYVDRGVTLFSMGRLREAEADYHKAISLDARLPEAAFNLALVELSDGRESEAEGHLQRALALRPDYAKAHFHLAQVYRKRGDPRAAEHAESAVQESGGVGRGPEVRRPVQSGRPDRRDPEED
jgi:arylsulfatase A-like enzyme/Flp pilus assembly protein TadD